MPVSLSRGSGGKQGNFPAREAIEVDCSKAKTESAGRCGRRSRRVDERVQSLMRAETCQDITICHYSPDCCSKRLLISLDPYSVLYGMSKIIASLRYA